MSTIPNVHQETINKKLSKSKISNWTSGNNDIDDLIQKCQLETISPNKIIEWIPYENLSNIEYFTKGGISKIYSADWVRGNYSEWNPKEKQLKRHGTKNIIVKILENVENANKDWFEEAKSHITISNKWAGVIQCYGLTKVPSNESYMLVMNHMSYDCWYIGDLGFCGPVDKPLGNIYGNLPYIAPEVIFGKEYTFASDIYRTPLEYKKLMKQCWDADPSKRPDIMIQ
ncbi:hypothetical protein C1645_841341 [Glomus cerebriforme]|uniref:Protein kinase domain-containing protein n=1 Tax=Glomus cerebriforme TaxID=658196 RepID=A0A397S490_9GLOM|nr:hypothetical protein C1645_841341 [Glomus cerebriforme]